MNPQLDETMNNETTVDITDQIRQLNEEDWMHFLLDN